jgi:murein DD-endopeptidase MepM/ murein hydrolase activator NlpD
MTAQTARSARSHRLHVAVIPIALLCLSSGGTVLPAAAESFETVVERASQQTPTEADWLWPVDGQRVVVAPFEAPAHEYAPGHRGVDIGVPLGAAGRAPADGVVAFRGIVVDRPLLTIDHGNGLVSTFEPMQSDLRAGDHVAAGDLIGTVSSGGHSTPDTVHIGVRLHGTYVDPMAMFGPVERAVLLPCCDPL